jgi:hypothetical protein
LRLALAAVLAGACAPRPSLAASTEATVGEARASVTPLAPLEPTPMPTPAARALTEAACCARHWWSADSTRVLFIDDPPGELPLGIYAAPTNGGEVSLVSTSPFGEDLPPGDVPFRATPAVPFRLPANAENILLSPDGTAVAWTVGSSLPVNIDRRQRSLWVVAGSAVTRRRLAVLTGGDLVGWAEGGQAVVATGRVGDGAPGVWLVPIDGSAASILAESERPRGTRLSPSGRWLAFYLAFESDPARNGMWIVPTSGGSARRVPAFGSYRWASDELLYLVPLGPTEDGLRLVTFEAATGDLESVRGDDPFPGGIAGNDWSVSPDGRWIVYRSAIDAALWIVPTGR